MSVRDVNGNTLMRLVDIDGNILERVCDYLGDTISIARVEAMDWSGMETTYQESVSAALTDMQQYVAGNSQSYAISQFCDVHQDFANDPNFIEYHKGDLQFSRMLFLGDLVNAYYATPMNDAVSFMNTAKVTRRIVCVGNHEYNGYEGDTSSGVDDYYKSVIDRRDVQWDNENGIVYYSDDDANNVRYIVMDCHYDIRDLNTYRLPLDEIKWIAGVLESSGGRDIIFCNHCVIWPFTALSNGATIEYENVIQNVNEYFVPLVKAYMNRDTYTLEIDGSAYSYDFSGCTGSVICYTCGHEHNPGYSNVRGFHMFSGPAKRNDTGISFFIVDRAKRKIRWYICPEDSGAYTLNEYGY